MQKSNEHSSVYIHKNTRTKTLGQKLRERGFDTTKFNRTTQEYTVGCSQCVAVVINGIACHETGCPNQSK